MAKPHLLFWGYLALLVVAFGLAHNDADPDIWHRLALGNYLFAYGRFPLAQTWSYLTDYPFTGDHEWGAGPLFAAIWAVAGGGGLIALKIVTLGATLAIIVCAGWIGRTPTWGAAAFYGLVLFALMLVFNSTVRCLVFTHLFLALFQFWERREQAGKRMPILAYFAVMVLWANLHGGFVIGLGWLALLAVVHWLNAKPAWRRTALLFCLCLPATLLNPFGLNLWRVTFRALTVPRTGFAEWAPVSWMHGTEALGYKILVLLTLATFFRRCFRMGVRAIWGVEVAVLLGAMIFSLLALRHTGFFAVTAGIYLPVLWREAAAARSQAEPETQPRLWRRLFPALTSAWLLVALVSLARMEPQLRRPSDTCAVGALNFLEQQGTTGRLLTDANGSYALWRLNGQMRVSLNTCYDLFYRPETIRRVDDFFQARGEWVAWLNSPAVRPDAILVPIGAPVLAPLGRSNAWRVVYRDQADALFFPAERL